MAKTTLSALRPNPRNPRTITDKKAKMLRDSLARFGDLSGIVFNRSSGQVVGGHQRIKAFEGLGASDVTIIKTYDEPSHAGTVAEGYVDIAGERYAYRETQWSDDEEKAANLAANKGAGEWDLSQVAQWIDELGATDLSLDLTMFDDIDRQSLKPMLASSDDGWDDALEKVPAGEQTGTREMAFILSADQVEVVQDRLAKMKALGPFVDTGNENSNGNALARLAELYHG